MPLPSPLKTGPPMDPNGTRTQCFWDHLRLGHCPRLQFGCSPYSRYALQKLQQPRRAVKLARLVKPVLVSVVCRRESVKKTPCSAMACTSRRIKKATKSRIACLASACEMLRPTPTPKTTDHIPYSRDHTPGRVASHSRVSCTRCMTSRTLPQSCHPRAHS